jgi:UDPglucose--hexose-1-phosphate uridylyltransferase
VFKRFHRKEDGRPLHLYGWQAHTLPPLEGGPHAPEARSHLRWHPLRGEWVAYAPHRAKRGLGSDMTACPLCPATDDTTGEIPFREFEVAVFENRFGSFHPDAPEAPACSVATERAVGMCEVVVYSPQHEGSMATLAARQRELVVHAWADRYRDLHALPEVRFVSLLENRGEILGMSLSHPHCQIHGLPYVPLVIEREVEAFRREPMLQRLLERLEPHLLVLEDKYHTAFVPPFARYAYEVWVVPKRFVPGPWSYSPGETRSLAWMLGEIVERYDLLAGGEFPYIMFLHASPKGEEEHFHFHVEFYPPATPEQKIPANVSVERGMWFHLLEASLEEAAERMRAVKD